MRRFAPALLAVVCAGCHLPPHRAPHLRPLQDEAAVFLYLDPFPVEAERLELSVSAIAAIRADGTAVPLDLVLSHLDVDTAGRQRLVAWGRLPYGAYQGLSIALAGAKLRTGDRAADLLVPKDPARFEAPFVLRAGQAQVLALSLRYGEAVQQGFEFTPAFTVLPPHQPVSEGAGYCTSTGWATVTVFERRARRVGGTVATGAEPAGLALDPTSRRAYVALGAEDRIQVVDLATLQELPSIQLRGGDRPREVALSSDGRSLLVTNSGSNSVSFLEPDSTVETTRVDVGVDPEAILMDRDGRRAFVLNRRSNSISIVDVANRAVSATVATEASPVRAQLDRAMSRLYVIHAGSAFMLVYSLPELAVIRRVFVGLGATGLRVDPRNDLVYVARREDPRLQVYDPFSFMPIAVVDLPGPASYLAIDDLENTLYALVPSQRAAAVVDLVGRRTVGLIDVGEDPYQVAFPQERR